MRFDFALGLTSGNDGIVIKCLKYCMWLTVL